MNAIDLTNLDIAYGDTKVVFDVNLSIPEGESFALVGESGSGKSTILRAIAGLAPDWTGDISVMGEARSHHVDRNVSRKVQMVFQDPYGSLHPRKTIDAALSEPLAIHGIGNRGERVEAMLTAVGLDQRFRFRFPHQLSGGQRQRVAIARALMLEPKVMLLDEPTSALDVSVQAQVLDIIDELVRNKGMGLILISHDLNLVSRYCDRILVMNAGQVVEECAAGQLENAQHPYTKGLLAAMPVINETRDELPVLDRTQWAGT